MIILKPVRTVTKVVKMLFIYLLAVIQYLIKSLYYVTYAVYRIKLLNYHV